MAWGGRFSWSFLLLAEVLAAFVLVAPPEEVHWLHRTRWTVWRNNGNCQAKQRQQRQRRMPRRTRGSRALSRVMALQNLWRDCFCTSIEKFTSFDRCISVSSASRPYCHCALNNHWWHFWIILFCPNPDNLQAKQAESNTTWSKRQETKQVQRSLHGSHIIQTLETYGK